MMLAGCATSPAKQTLQIALPQPPAINRVPPPAIAPGASPKALLGKYAVALDTANGRIGDYAAWYAAVRAQYAAGAAIESRQ